MRRTIVVSDLHGNAAPLESALTHAAFDPALDRLITAGDLIDTGRDDVIGRAAELGATMLVGNHEVAAALGLQIFPQSPESLQRGDEFIDLIGGGAWTLAADADGWLVTHAGVSAAMSDIIGARGGDVAAIARELNERFADEFAEAVKHRPISWGDLDRYRLLGGQNGPLWFRPMGTYMLAGGIRQIVGHTPPELLSPDDVRLLASAGWLLVDSGGHVPRMTDDGQYRYAVIEQGEARVVES